MTRGDVQQRLSARRTRETAGRPGFEPEPPAPLALRIDDIAQKREWRIIYYVGTLAIAVLDVFDKTTRATPDDVVRNCKRRLADFKTKDKP